MDNTATSLISQNPSSPFKFVVRTGLLVGFLDIAAAFINAYLQFGSTPVMVFQYIASGVFGKAAFSGGLMMAMWGCVFHFLIATSWTFLFFLVYPRMKILSRNRVVSGVLYGLVIWLVMNLVVLPLASTPKPPSHDPIRMVEGILILMAMVGVPVSLKVHKYFSRI